MKYLIESLSEIEEKIRSYPGYLLLLDFDGTLSALAETPSKAFLYKENRLILLQISRLVPTAIVSGRSLTDVKQKVGLKKLIYAGNHGLEWQIAGKRKKIRIPAKMTLALKVLNKQLCNLCKKYHGALLENKDIGVSLHYRLVNLHTRNHLLKEAKRLIKPFQKNRLLKITKSKKTLEIRPSLSWNKGYWVKLLHQKLGKQLLPIYIGDDITDEDVFKILRPGITIRVGKSHNSKASFYCNNITEVSLFLAWFLNELKSNLKP